MKLKWWEIFTLIVFASTLVTSVVIPWLSEKLVYDRLVFGVIFAVAVIVVAGWTTFQFSRGRPKRDMEDRSEALKNTSPPQEYQQVFPHKDEDKKKRVVWIIILTVFIILMIAYMHQRGDVEVIRETLSSWTGLFIL